MPNDAYPPPPHGANDGIHLLRQMDVEGAMRNMLVEVFGEAEACRMLADQAERKQLIEDLNKIDPQAIDRFRKAGVPDQHGVPMNFTADNDTDPSLHNLRMLFYTVKDEQRERTRKAEEAAFFAHMSPAERKRFIARQERHDRLEKTKIGRLVNDARGLWLHAFEAVRLVMEIAPRARFAELRKDWRDARALTAYLRTPDEDSAPQPATETPAAKTTRPALTVIANSPSCQP